MKPHDTTASGQATLALKPFQAPDRLHKLTVEVTTLCNLMCKGCPRTIGVASGTWRNATMSAESFARVVDTLPPVGSATLHGIGEPMLNPELPEIVRIARESGKFGILKVTTNGLTRAPEAYRAVVDAGLDAFWVSIDSLDQGIADIVRYGTKVDKLRDRMAWFMAEGLPVEVSMVVGAENYRSIPETLRILHDNGNPPVHLQEFQDYGDASGLMSLEQRLWFLDALKRLMAELDDPRIHPPTYMRRPTESLCLAPWFRPGITVDGYLTPCCTTFDASLFGFQDLKSRSWEEIWADPAVHGWIRQYIAKSQPICAGCALNPRNWRPDAELGSRGGDVEAMWTRAAATGS